MKKTDNTVLTVLALMLQFGMFLIALLTFVFVVLK
ncbi:putative holin-like toxin [Tumebacillus sp. DT12]|uniref:Holin-like toxin n=1 Tax=Tumebacillus lacus TaxID=2995335 RepID=A0ABT3X6G4_9BACL|nr:putative holin-like toxin [Tumebacillus lacus]MCX7572036.1 putative holin-like toxin [Tumebacillus lacus]